MAHEPQDKLGDHGGIGAVRVLAAAEDIEVAQADGLHSVELGEVPGIEFIDILGDGIRRERLADLVLDFRQRLAVAISRAAGGIDEAPDLGIAGSNQHVEEAHDIDFGREDRVFDGTRDRADRRLVQDEVDAGAGLVAGGEVADVALDQAEARIVEVGLDVASVAGEEVVQADDVVVLLQQDLDKIGADKARAAGDEDF